MRLVEPDGSELIATNLRASATTRELSTQDIVVLAVKAHQIGGIADQLPSLYASDTIVMTVQNGLPWWFFQGFGGEYEGRRIEALDPDGTINRFIPGDRIVGCIAYPAAAGGRRRCHPSDRRRQVSRRRTRRYAIRTRADNCHECSPEAGFKARVLTDIRQHLWIKAWGNLALNPISALTGATLVEICRFPPTRQLAAQMMHEAAEVAAQLGLPLRLSIEQRLDGAEKVGAHKTSMLQDVEAGRAL